MTRLRPSLLLALVLFSGAAAAQTTSGGGAPIASATRLGVIKTDNGVSTSVDADGTLHAVGAPASLTNGGSAIASGAANQVLTDNGGTLTEIPTTGTGNSVRATSPTLVTPALGTPSAVNLTNGTALPVGGISGLGTGVGTALGSAVTGSGGIVLGTSPTLTTPALGTPSAVNLTNGTALPVSGISGLGTGVGSALGSAVTGSGGIVLGASPTLTTPALGTPSAVNLTNGTALPVAGVVGPTGGGTQCLHTNNAGAISGTGSDCGAGGGGSVSVTSASPQVVITPSPGTGTFTIGTTVAANVQSGSSYTIVAGDAGKVVERTNTGGAQTDTLPNVSTTGFGAGFGIPGYCSGPVSSAQQVTITVTSPSTVNGSSTLVIPANTCVSISDPDGSNYVAYAQNYNATLISSGTLAAARGGAGTINGALKGNGSGVVSQAACADLSNAAASCSTDTTSASNISAGTLAAARGGAGTIAGALKGNGSGVVSQAACADLSNAAASCSTDTTSASNISAGTLAAARGGAGTITGALKGNGSGVVSQAACADLSNAAASCATDATNATNLSSGTVAVARGGTGANLSGTGGTSQVLKQASVGAAVTVGQLAITDVTGFPGPAYTANNWYWPENITLAIGNTLSTTTIYARPFILTKKITIGALAADIATLGTSNFQLAIYASNAAGTRPSGTALCSTANIVDTSTGFISGACATSSLAPGVYFMETAANDATVKFFGSGTNSATGYMIGTATLANLMGTTTTTTLEELSVAGQTFGTWPDETSTSWTEVAATGTRAALVAFQVSSVP